jgi:lipoprotein-anchoring transpeptidase ErfK/SrfK
MFRGVDLPGTDPKDGAGFILSTKASKYQVDPDKERVAALGAVERFTVARLTGKTFKSGTNVYRETTDGWWMRTGDGTFTEPGPPPQGLLPGEKWIDVNLSRQTLVAFEGDKPVYATIVSSGKKAKDPNDKVHDHQTIQGSFRIREKHISTTMDGDGPAPGDMPYSIEDVPFVMYFEGSYALHAAFWHNNFGHEQSHGCVNLAPLDAKRLFFWSDPPLPEGWHGVIAAKDRPGTRVVVHESSDRP